MNKKCVPSVVSLSLVVSLFTATTHAGSLPKSLSLHSIKASPPRSVPFYLPGSIRFPAGSTTGGTGSSGNSSSGSSSGGAVTTYPNDVLMGQEIRNEINKIRANPRVYFKSLMGLFTKTSTHACFGAYCVPLNDSSWQEIVALGTIKNSTLPVSLPLLQESAPLMQIAADWAKASAQTGTLSHGNFGERLNKYLATYQAAGENIAMATSAQAKMFVLLWIVDYGVSSRGHRQNIMNSSYTHIGHGCSGSFVKQPVMNFCVVDFATNPIAK